MQARYKKLGLVTSMHCALAGAALAMPDRATAADIVTLYGIVDSYVGAIHSNGDTTKSLDSGGLQVSRFGMQGSESLGDGWRTVFRLEGGFNTSNGTASVNGQIFGRETYVGFSHAEYGELRLGKQNSVFFNMLGRTAAFYGGTFAAGLGTESGYNFRNNNEVSYMTPRWAGLRLHTRYAFGDRMDTSRAGRVWQLAVDYEKGPWYFLVAHVNNTLAPVGDAPFMNVKNRQTTVGGAYTLNPFTFYLSYFKNEQTDGAIDKDLYSVSVAWHLSSADQLSVGYTYIDAQADTGNVAAGHRGGTHANHYGVMYLHRLSKRTTLYAAGAWIDNAAGGQYAIGAAQAPRVDWRNRPDPGTDTRGVQVGIRHTF
ncbi:porin [Bordetella genomosp. 13]|uniref:Porin domain-containing protein n=1 Tax=Bordetella genomosp. 13 TaxID=463040 RepID=A0A1W6Z9R8_9BORD|nr:porin [Bordetella genomosp. 13]ARP94123.1 hypothetical protein CAL15_06830 [Bordetella genomosp. 13]